METHESGVKFARRQPILEALVGKIGAKMVFDIARNETSYLPVTIGPHILTVRDFPWQTRHDGFEIQEGRSSTFFGQVSVYEAVYFLVRPA